MTCDFLVVQAYDGIVLANAAPELREFVRLTECPTVNTLMGLGSLASDDPNFISMPGMHGSYAANMALTNAYLLIALGVRFDARSIPPMASTARRTTSPDVAASWRAAVTILSACAASLAVCRTVLVISSIAAA